MFGHIVSGIIGAGASIYSSKKSDKQAKKNTATQIAWEKERAKNAHQWEAEDLEKAGLNRALTGASGGAQTNSISPQMGDTSGYKDATTTAINNFREIQKGQNEKASTDADVSLKKSEAIKNGVETGLLPENTAANMIRAEAERQNAETKRMESIAYINRLEQMLPFETEEKRVENLRNAIRLVQEEAANEENLTESEIKTRKAKLDNEVNKLTGGLTTASELKTAIGAIVGGVFGGKMLNSATKVKDYKTEYYDNKGVHKGTVYREYRK